jgi:hypothetical protein
MAVVPFVGLVLFLILASAIATVYLDGKFDITRTLSHVEQGSADRRELSVPCPSLVSH